MAENLRLRNNSFPDSGSLVLNISKLAGAGTDISDSDEESLSEDDVLFIEEALSQLSLGKESADTEEEEVHFDRTQCLFCNQRSPGFDENLEHMSKRHGLFIPDSSNLIVDVETLAEYLHLVIFVYFECLYCGSQRSSAQAAQQHMTGKGHCKIDIHREGSEFKEFFDFDASSEKDEDEATASGNKRLNFVVAEGSMRLPSGKLLSHRTEAKHRQSQRPRSSSTNQSTALEISRSQSHQALSQSAQSESNKIAKREANFHNQLATVRAGDRMSLIHLTRTQQRAVILKGRKQVERARKDANDLLLRIQTKANR